MRIIEPPLSELDSLRTPLTRGERKVLDFFRSRLPINWEIYIQPHLNGLQPDFVLLNPNVGIGIFEVKDWIFNRMDYFVDSGRLWGRKDGTQFCIDKYNPIRKLADYKKDLLEIYCPRLGMQVAKMPKAYATITIGAIFPFASSAFVKDLFSQFFTENEFQYFGKYNLILGREDLEEIRIAKVFPEAGRKSSQFMNEELVYDLRGWLVEPEFSREQRTPIKLDANQKKFVNAENPPVCRRIKGCAGSGKTFVIGARAARLAAEGKKVLICVYNITLINYIRDIIATAITNKSDWRNIIILHFHGLCSRICSEMGHTDEYASYFPKTSSSDLCFASIPRDIFDKKIPDLIKEILMECDVEEREKYDALLVDEGQDFLPGWWEILCLLVKPGGEKLFVADPAQDIYNHTREWSLEDIAKAGFHGPWNFLFTSYRLPEKIAYIANFFIRKYFAEMKIPIFKKGQIPPERQKELWPSCHVKWVACKEAEARDTILACMKEMMMNTGLEIKKAVSDITFLCDKIKLGSEVIADLEKLGIKTLHTFYLNFQESRISKMCFYKGAARIKATTLHSFKGWESSMIVFYISHLLTDQEKYLFYVALTRLKYTQQGSYMTIIYSGNEEDYADVAKYINGLDEKNN